MSFGAIGGAAGAAEALRATYTLEFRDAGLSQATAADRTLRESVTKTGATLTKQQALYSDLQGKQKAMWMETSRVAVAANKATAEAAVGAQGKVSSAVSKSVATMRQAGLSYDQAATHLKAYGATAAETAAAIDASAKKEIAAHRAHGAALTDLGGRIQSAGSRAATFGRTISGLALPAAIAGAAAGKMAIDFQKSMELIHTQAGASQAEVNRLSGAVLDLAKTTPQGPGVLADGLYHLESVGLRTRQEMEKMGVQGRTNIDVMKALKIASDGAAVGNSNLEDTATALGAAWLVNIKGGGDLKQVMGTLNATVGAGNVRMGELVQALGTGVLPASKVAGLSIRDTMGALAVFTDEGYQASSAAAQFATSLHFLYDPTNKARGAMEQMGLSGNQLAIDMRKPNGLLVALTDLHDHLDRLKGGAKGVQAEQTLGAILPGGRGRILLTLLNQLDRYQQKLTQIKNTSANFEQDVTATQDTAANKLKVAWSGIEAAAINLGAALLPAVVPPLTKIASAVADAVGQFSHLSPTVKTAALGAVVLGVALGPVLRIVGSLTTVVGGAFKGLGLLTRLLFPTSSLFAKSATNAEVLTAATDRLVAANERLATSFEAVGVGARAGAAGIATEEAAVGAGGLTTAEGSFAGALGAARSRTALAAGEGAALTGAEVAAPSMLGKVAGVGGKLLRGGAIAGVGVLGAQTIGGMVGGHTGYAISTVGTTAAVGAGLGSFLGPEGMVAGGVAGALVGGFKMFLQHNADKYGQQIADKVTKPLGAAVQHEYGDRIAKELNQAHRTAQGAQTNRAAQGVYGQARGSTTIPGTNIKVPGGANLDALAQQQFGKAGADAGKAFAMGVSKVRFPSTLQLFEGMKRQLAALPPEARGSAASAMLQYAQTLQAQGKVPHTAVKNLIASLEAEFPGLEVYLKQHGASMAADFAVTMKMTTAVNNTQKLRDTLKATFGDIFSHGKITSDNLLTSVTGDYQALRENMGTLTKQGAAAARKEMAQLRQAATSDAAAMGQNVDKSISDMRTSLVNNSATAVAQSSKSFSTFVTNVQAAMSAGTVATSKGVQIIGDALNNALKLFGEKPLSLASVKALSPAQLGAVASGHVSSGAVGDTGGGNPGHATGGKVTTPTYIVGEEAPQHHEYVLATNPAYRNRNMKLWAAAGHDLGVPGFARGGIVTASQYGGSGDPSSGAHGYRGDNLYQHPDSFAELNMGHALGGLPYMAPLNVSYHGKTAKLLKRDIGAGGPGIGGHPRAIDLWFQAAQSLGFSGLDLVQLNSGSGVNLNVAGGAGGAAVPQVSAPRVGGTGAVVGSVRGALGLVAKAANAFIAAHAPAAGPGGSAPGTVMATGGKPSQIEAAMMAGAAQIMGKPYIFGGGHGGFSAPGYDCSGAVSYVLHSAGLLGSPMSTDGFKTWGEPGPGKYITTGVRGTTGANAHMMMSMFGKYLESGGGGPFGKHMVHWDPGWDGGFPILRHPKGLFQGGRMGDFGEVDPGWLLKTSPGLSSDPDFQNYVHARSRKQTKFAGGFARGGGFTAHGPTMAMFGEGGRIEDVYAIPRAAGGVINDPGSWHHAGGPSANSVATGLISGIPSIPATNVGNQQFTAVLQKLVGLMNQLTLAPLVKREQETERLLHSASTRADAQTREESELKNAIAAIQDAQAKRTASAHKHLTALKSGIDAERKAAEAADRETRAQTHQVVTYTKDSHGHRVKHTRTVHDQGHALQDVNDATGGILSAARAAATGSADQARIALRGLEDKLRKLRADKGPETAVRRLTKTLDDIQKSVTAHLTGVATAAAHVISGQSKQATILDRYMRATGTDPSSSAGLGVQLGQEAGHLNIGRAQALATAAGAGNAPSAGAIAGLVGRRTGADGDLGELVASQRRIQDAIKKAHKLGQTKAEATLKAQLGQTNDAIQEMYTDILQAARARIEASAQEGVTKAQHGESMVASAQQGLGIQQQLAGTAGTGAGDRQMAGYIQSNVLPALQNTMTALQNQYAAAKSVGDTGLADQIAEAISGKMDDIAQAQLDVLNDIKQATEETAAAGVASAQHNETLVSTAQQHLELTQQLGGVTGLAAAQQTSDFIMKSVIPALQSTLDALTAQQQAAASVGDQTLADQIGESIAAKQNDILSAQLDAQQKIRDATQATASDLSQLSGATGFGFDNMNFTDALISTGVGA